MLQENSIPVDFGQGIDTKTDPKQVVAGKMLKLQNAVFTNPKRITKRNGYTALPAALSGGGSLSAPTLVHAYGSELLAADQGSLFSYSPSQSVWINKGSYVSTEVSKQTIDQSRPMSGYADVAASGNYALYAYSSANQPNSFVGGTVAYSQVYTTLVDLSSNAIIDGPRVQTANSSSFVNQPRCVLLGGSVLAIAYVKDDAQTLVMRTLSIAAGVATFSGELTIGTMAASFSFDVVQTATGASVAYLAGTGGSATGLTIANVNTSGAVTSSVVITDAQASGPVSLSVNSNNNNLWVYWINSTAAAGNLTSASIVYAVYTSTLTPVLSKTTVFTQAAPYWVTSMAVVSNSSTSQTLYYGQYTGSASSLYTDASYQITVSSAGVVGSRALFSNGVAPYSKAFSVSGSNYAAFVYRGTTLKGNGNFNLVQTQPTFFIVKLGQTAVVVGRYGSGQGNLENTLSTIIGVGCNVPLLSSSKVLLPGVLETQQYAGDVYVNRESFPGGLAGVFSYSLDFASSKAYRAVNAGGVAVLNGALPQIYDGQAVSEFGYHMFPEINNVSTSGASGNIAAGLYSYLAIFQWTDNQGNLHQSAPSSPVSITTSGPTSTNTITVSTAFLSTKTNVSVALYRTQASGTVYYLVTDPVFLTSASPLNAFVSFQDTLADAVLSGNPPAYSYSGSGVLKNTTPPPSMIMLSHNNRLWFVDSENPNTIWYTKSTQPSVGLSPSALMTEQLDPKLGVITALAELDDKLVIFKSDGIFIQSGDGVSDAGSGATLSFPQAVPSDVGCDNLKSVVVVPDGILFHSSNGIYMINRALGVSYVGLEVEGFNSQVISSAQLIPGTSQIRFLTTTGQTLVRDYIFGQWSTFTNHTGTSSTSWNKTYVYATSSGAIFKEAPGVYADNGAGFSVLAQTSWLNLTGVQGFQRVRRLSMLGDFANGVSSSHAVQVQASYDFSSTVMSTVPYVFGGQTVSGVVQYRERLPQQKCDTIQLTIQEITTGDSSEFFALANISFEASLKKGLNKLPATQSVG